MFKEHWEQAFFWYINWTSQSIVSNNCFDIHMIGLKVCFDSFFFIFLFLDKCDWCRGIQNGQSTQKEDGGTPPSFAAF